MQNRISKNKFWPKENSSSLSTSIQYYFSIDSFLIKTLRKEKHNFILYLIAKISIFWVCTDHTEVWNSVFLMVLGLLSFILRVTGKFGLGIWNEAGQRLIEFCQENALVITNTLFQQHKRRLYTWTSPDGQHRNQIDYTLCSQRWRSSIQSAKTRPAADCGSDHELLIAKFRLKL